ncbi:MAG: tRNA-guanine transglycosylase [Alphaproteobacteria bacterium]|nr:tRNA-guanine transglycosylase [Alphaproteobacteria bacterium]
MELRPALPLGVVDSPLFVPDATYGAIKGLGADELPAAGVRVLMANAFHLMRSPGVTRIKALGGLKRMMGWSGVLMTDSGGFQALSLIRENAGRGRITARGLDFAFEDGAKVQLTPEKAITTQLRLGGDILFCLDDCTRPEDPEAEQILSVERTIAWARACKDAFAAQLGKRARDPDRPRLWGVVQGGQSLELRRQCAQALLDIGFDGYGFGGWPLDSDGKLLTDTLALVRDLIPAQFPLHALGVGHPVSVAACGRMGYTLCDSALPTRDARRGRLYCFSGDVPAIDGEGWFKTLYLGDEVHARNDAPISQQCSCLTCRTYSRGYLHHLFKRDEPLYWRLATIHNLWFMRQVTDLVAAERAR